MNGTFEQPAFIYVVKTKIGEGKYVYYRYWSQAQATKVVAELKKTYRHCEVHMYRYALTDEWEMMKVEQ